MLVDALLLKALLPTPYTERGKTGPREETQHCLLEDTQMRLQLGLVAL